MIDLREKLADTLPHLEACLVSCRDKGIGVLFYHTHPNYGQSHLYLMADSTLDEDDIIGEPIDDVIDYAGWDDATSWWEGEDNTGKVDLVLLNGDHSFAETNDEFNEIWALQVAQLIRESISLVDRTLLPKRIVVSGECGEGHSEWLVAD